MNITDVLFIIGFWGIWSTLTFWIILSIGSIRYRQSAQQEYLEIGQNMGPFPSLSVLVPAHNEELVIERTVVALAKQEYASENYEIIVVNDGSTDKTGEVVQRLQKEIPNLKLVNVPPGEGGKGKSRTLNVGFKHTTGDLIAIFDADNTPEPSCLRLLVTVLQNDTKLVAVNSKVRTRNKNASWLTRFINLEFIYFQWLFQGGRWHWFRLSMLMGTGYVIYKETLDLLGGFDENSLVDDTEMSLRIFRGNYRIRWVPFATTWEQEPDTFKVWFKQRTRWSIGNIVTTWKYLPAAFVMPYPLGLEVLVFVLNFVIFIPALLASNTVLILGLLGADSVTLPGPFMMLWALSIIVYSFHMAFAIKQEDDVAFNYFYAFIGYFTYAQFFIPVLLNAFWQLIKQSFQKEHIQWDKTARKKEKQ